MDSTRSPDRTGEILAHLEWIRETLCEQKERAQEDREAFRAHEEEDREQFAAIWSRLNRIGGGLTLLVSLLGLAGAGAAWARLVLD